MAFWLIAAIGPALWFLDALAVSILFKVDFIKQLFFPRSFDLLLCAVLLLLPLLAAILFCPRPASQELLEQQLQIEDSVNREAKVKIEQAVKAARQEADEKVMELKTGFARELELKLAEERKRIEMSIRKQEEEKATERYLRFEENYEERLQQARSDEAARITDAIRMQERRDADEKIKTLQASFAQEIETRVAAERKVIEERVRLEEQKRPRMLLPNFARNTKPRCVAVSKAKPSDCRKPHVLKNRRKQTKA